MIDAPSEPASRRRFGEVVRLGPQHVKNGRIRIERIHGSDDVDIPVSPELQAACDAANQPLQIRMQPGYDHSYWFIQTFIEDHLRHHAAVLCR